MKRKFLILSNNLLNDKKISKATYNKLFALFMGNARMNALEDAYNTLVNIKKSSKEVIKKSEFHELKTNEKIAREIKEGKEDKFMMLISKKNQKPLAKLHLTAIMKKKLIPIKTQVKL
jgi:hypothetical protein